MDGIRHEIEARLESVRGEISGIRNEINSLRSEMGSLRNEFLAEIKRLDEPIGSLRREVELALEIREEIGGPRGQGRYHPAHALSSSPQASL